MLKVWIRCSGETRFMQTWRRGWWNFGGELVEGYAMNSGPRLAFEAKIEYKVRSIYAVFISNTPGQHWHPSMR